MQLLTWWSSPIKNRTQRRFDLVKRDCLRTMLIVIGQDQFIIEHIHGVYKCINQSFLKLTVCWIAMTELLKPCRHLFAGQLMNSSKKKPRLALTIQKFVSFLMEGMSKI